MKIKKLNLRSRRRRADSPKGRLNRILVVVSVMSAFAALGCELIVDFDRTRIPVEVTEGGPEGGASDASNDGPATSDAGDAAPADASDAGEDADAGIADAATDG
jgi:hypothetical protein